MRTFFHTFFGVSMGIFGFSKKGRKVNFGKPVFVVKIDPFLGVFGTPFLGVFWGFLGILGARPVYGYRKLGIARPDGLHWGYAPPSMTAVA